jgi:RimJ/RimL family protein N-acetyltransferase
MRKLVYKNSDLVKWWVGQQLECSFPDQCIGIGIIDDDDDEPELIAGVLYYNYHAPKGIEMTIASVAPWSTKGIIQALFHYPFNQLGCSRVTSIIDIDNTHTAKFLDNLGFTKEGVMRDANPNGDAVIYGLLKTECKWIK